MLLHSIAPYKPQLSAVVVETKPAAIGKHEYNALISKLKYRKGDMLISSAINADNITQSHAVFKVKDIQEVHFLCDWERGYQGEWQPKVYHLTNPAGHSFWTVEQRWIMCPDNILNKLDLFNESNWVNK